MSTLLSTTCGQVLVEQVQANYRPYVCHLAQPGYDSLHEHKTLCGLVVLISLYYGRPGQYAQCGICYDRVDQ